MTQIDTNTTAPTSTPAAATPAVASPAVAPVEADKPKVEDKK